MNAHQASVRLVAGLVVVVLLFAPPGRTQECPARVHRWGGPAVTVALSGTHALIANWDALQVVDVSDPTTPRVIGEVALQHAWVTDISVADGYAYVGHAEGLQIIDVSNPSSPAGVGLVEIPYVRKVAVSGHRAYLLHDRTLSIVDVSDPANPVRIGFLDRLWGTRGLAAAGDYAYLATYVGNQPSLRVIDVSTPENPTEAAVVTFPESGWPAFGVDDNPVAVSGDLAFLLFVSYQGYPALFFVVDISTPIAPIKLGFLSTHAGVAWVGNMVVSGDLVYTSDGVIVDVSDPANPVEGGRLGEVGAVAVSGRYAYQAVDLQGLRVLDVSDPASPVEVGSLRTYADAVATSGSHAYVAIRGGGLRVLDASKPYDPVEVGRCDLPPQSHVHSIELAGDHAFVAAGGAGLRIIEISDPENPREVGAVAAEGWTAHVAVSDGRALVHDGSRNGGPGEAVRIIDVSDPSDPTQVGSFDGLNRVSGLAVSGDIAFVSTRPDGLRVLDISNPADPVEIASVPVRWSNGGVAVSGNYAYLGDSSVGVRILDVSDPARPVEVGTSACHIAGVEVSGGFAYCHGEWGDTGLGVIDVSTPAMPLQAGFYETRTGRDVRPYTYTTPRRFNDFPGSISQVAVSGGSVYLAAGRFEILDAGCLNTRWLGIAAHLEGRHDSHWRTDVVALNTGASDANVTLTLHMGAEDLTTTASIAASTQGVFEDIVGSMGASGKGPIEIRSDQPLAVAGRIYNEAESGTYGQHIDSGPAWKGIEAGESDTLLGLRQQDGRFRTNLSVTNLGTEAASVSVSLHGTDGTELARYPFDVESNAVVQDLEPFAQRAGLPDLGWGFARVRVDAGGSVMASASVVDALTNDATTVPAAREPREGLTGEFDQWLEIAAHLPGQSGSGWRTDLVARNPSGSDATVDLVLHTSDGEVTARDAVPAQHQGVFEDVVGLLGVEGKGALEIRSSVALEIGARIFNRGESGTYGQSLPAASAQEGLISGESAWLVGLRQRSDEYRTHISVTNSGTEPAAVTVTLIATDGTELVSYPFEVRPGMTRQDLQPFKWRAGRPDLGWGFARVGVVSGRGVLTSASVIDSRTNDAVTVTMQR